MGKRRSGTNWFQYCCSSSQKCFECVFIAVKDIENIVNTLRHKETIATRSVTSVSIYSTPQYTTQPSLPLTVWFCLSGFVSFFWEWSFIESWWCVGLFFQRWDLCGTFFWKRGMCYLFSLRKDGVHVWILFFAGSSWAAVSYVPDFSFCPYFWVWQLMNNTHWQLQPSVALYERLYVTRIYTSQCFEANPKRDPLLTGPHRQRTNCSPDKGSEKHFFSRNIPAWAWPGAILWQ